jgi:aryl-alcohol dehydrogenase
MTRSIRAAVARAQQPFVIETVELDEPRAHEVRVELEACGLCHTDLHAKDHDYGTPLPAVLGHEGVGRIEATGPGVQGFEIGDRVVMSFGACGECPSCCDRMPAYCRHAIDFNVLGRRRDGSSPLSSREGPLTGHFFGQSSFATHAIACATNLVRVPNDIPAAELAPLACGVQTGVGAVVHSLDAGPADTIGIFGCGTVGLAAVMAARIVGCERIVAVDVRDERLELALTLGATDIINNARTKLPVALRELGGLTLAFDNTGQPEVIEPAFAALRVRGRMVLAGVSPRNSTLRIDPNRMMGGGRTLRGTVEGDADPTRMIPRMLEWVRAGQLPIGRLVTCYPFEQIDAAANDMLAGRVIKPVLVMNRETRTST